MKLPMPQRIAELKNKVKKMQFSLACFITFISIASVSGEVQCSGNAECAGSCLGDLSRPAQRVLQTATWADFNAETSSLVVDGGRRPIQMMNSQGTGTPLVKKGQFGADVIRFGPGEMVGNHTHVGQHVLFVIRGTGIVNYDGIDYNLRPGLVYLVESMVPHAIYGGTEDSLVLLVCGDDHRSLGDPARMEPVY